MLARGSERLDELRAALRTESWAETELLVVDCGGCYGDGNAVEVSIRKRGRRYDLDDRGAATTKAGNRGMV